MPELTPISGADTGLPLRAYLKDLQTKALQAESLLDSAAAFMGDPVRGSLCLELMETARQICAELNGALDSVRLPKGELQ